MKHTIIFLVSFKLKESNSQSRNIRKFIFVDNLLFEMNI